MSSAKKNSPETQRTLSIRTVHQIPPLYSNAREKNPIAYVRFYASWSKKSWYVFEWNGGDRFFGMETEGGTRQRRFGLYSLSDLAALRGPFDMPIVQDYAFQPTPLNQLRKHFFRS